MRRLSARRNPMGPGPVRGLAPVVELRRLVVRPLVLIEEAPRRPVVLGVAAARAVERGDVLERDENVAVQLDVRHVGNDAVRSEHAVLVLAPEEGELDRLAHVPRRVVVHRGQSR